MSLRNLLGSPAASALLGNPVVEGIAIGTRAVLVVGVGAVWGGHKLYQHFRKKHLEKYIAKMKKVNDIYNKHVGNISSRFIENKSFPPLFKFDTADKNVVPQCILLSAAQFKSAGKFTGERRLNRSEIDLDDPMLLIYLEELSMAIRKLKLYCKDLDIAENDEKENDDQITLYVLHHSISIIDSFMSFKGFYWDIDCVHHFAQFIQEYYLSFESNNSQHQTHLKEVFLSLQKAETALRAHQDELTIEDMLEQLLKTSLDAEQYLMSIFTKLVVSNEHEYLVDYADADDLKQGILRKEATMKRLGELTISKKHEVRLHDSILSDWVKKINDFHLKVIDKNYYIKKEEMQVSWLMFNLSSVKDNSKEFKKLQDHFNDCANFMTRIADPESETKLIKIKDQHKLYDRTEKLALIPAVTYKDQCLIKLLTVLINSEKLLGEIRFAKPDLFNRVRQILRGVIDDVTQSIKKIAAIINQVDVENNQNIPHPGKTELVPGTLFDDLEKICFSWSEMLAEMDKRETSLIVKMKILSRHAAREVKHDLFKFLNLYADRFNIPFDMPEDKTTKTEVMNATIFTRETDIKYLDVTLKAIVARIEEIQKNDNVDANHYAELLNELLAMQQIVRGLFSVNKQVIEEDTHTLNFVLSLAHESKDFLSGDKEKRNKSAQTFVNVIQDIAPTEHAITSPLLITSVSVFKINPKVQDEYKKMVETCQKIVKMG